jgi:hypothetical protein
MSFQQADPRKSPVRWLHLTACVTLSFAMASIMTHHANAQTYWQVDGQITDAQQCPFRNLEMRVRCRWVSNVAIGLGPNPIYIENPWSFPWGTPNGVHQTNDQGGYSIATGFPLLFPYEMRDILIEARSWRTQNIWTEIILLEDVDINDRSSVQGDTWHFDLGTLSTDLLGSVACDIVWSDSSEDEPRLRPVYIDPRNPGDDEDNGKSDDDDNPFKHGVIKEVPYGFNGDIDLEIVDTLVVNREPHDSSKGITTSFVTVRNNGMTTYDKNAANAKLSLTLPHLSANPVNSWEVTVPSLAPGEEKNIVMSYGNFQTDQSEFSASNAYEIIYQVDSTQVVFESDESNNWQTGWYTPATGNYE